MPSKTHYRLKGFCRRQARLNRWQPRGLLTRLRCPDVSSRTFLFGLAFTSGMTTAARSGIAGLAVLAITAVSPGAATVTAAGSPWSPAARMVQPHQAATATLLANRKRAGGGGVPLARTGAQR